MPTGKKKRHTTRQKTKRIRVTISRGQTDEVFDLTPLGLQAMREWMDEQMEEDGFGGTMSEVSKVEILNA